MIEDMTLSDAFNIIKQLKGEQKNASIIKICSDLIDAHEQQALTETLKLPLAELYYQRAKANYRSKIIGTHIENDMEYAIKLAPSQAKYYAFKATYYHQQKKSLKQILTAYQAAITYAPSAKKKQQYENEQANFTLNMDAINKIKNGRQHIERTQSALSTHKENLRQCLAEQKQLKHARIMLWSKYLGVCLLATMGIAAIVAGISVAAATPFLVPVWSTLIVLGFFGGITFLPMAMKQKRDIDQNQRQLSRLVKRQQIFQENIETCQQTLTSPSRSFVQRRVIKPSEPRHIIIENSISQQEMNPESVSPASTQNTF